MAVTINGTTGEITSAVPAGLVMFYCSSTLPAGFLKCNGAAVSRSTYSSLFTAIGTTFGTGDGSSTFNLPDMRGYFARGWVDDGTIDSGRAFGSSQTDELKSHTHTASQRSSTAGAAQPYTTIGSGAVGAGSISLASTGGTETRPYNVALLACIKY